MAGLLDRLHQGLADDLRALSTSGMRASASLRTALAAVLTTLAALALHLDNPWWAAITGIVIIQADAAATLSRSVDRVIGTCIGAAIGYLASATIADHPVFLLIIATNAGLVIYAQERAQHNYAVLLGGVTVLLVMFGALADPDAALDLAFYRAAEICLGVGVACAVDFALAEPGTSTALPRPRPGVWTAPIDRELAAVALTGGIAIATIPAIWTALQLPGLDQTPITAFVILTAMRQDPVWKALTRAAGCLLGGIYGLAVMHLVGDAFLAWLAAMFLGFYVAAHISHGAGDAAYVGTQAGVAIVLAMVQGQGPTADILPAVDRLIGMFGGVVVVAIAHSILFPMVRSLIVKP